jgi:hypothetical protein
MNIKNHVMNLIKTMIVSFIVVTVYNIQIHQLIVYE